jgi:putative membrane protein
MMFWYGNGINGWGYALMAVSMIAFWGLVVAAVFYLVPTGQASARATPAQILAERFARGEITEEEYRRHFDTVHLNPPSLSKSHPHL